MSHVVEAIYANGVLKLAKPLPLQDQERVRVTVESVTAQEHSVMDIEPISLGKVYHALSSDNDLLGEMLEERL